MDPLPPFTPPPVITNVDWSTPDNVLSRDPIIPLQISTTPSLNSGGTMGILDQFRDPAFHTKRPGVQLPPYPTPLLTTPSFNVNLMTEYLDGGKKHTLRRKFIQNPTRTGQFLDKYTFSRPKAIEAHISHFTNIHDKYVTRMIPSRLDVAAMTQIAVQTGTLANHYGLACSTLLSTASDDQCSEWLPLAMQLKITIGYAQTELGAGSNVRGIQTTAVYSTKHKCFILNSNTLLGIKWWPGQLGAVCTHALVYAQLIIDDKEYGVHCFFVQVRDENHASVPGVEIGDNGNCIGDFGNDTGFLRLTNVVIPHFNMLARYQQVDPDTGMYELSEEKKSNPDSKISYITMVQTRGGMVSKQYGILARAVTIVSRYSFLRTQGFVSNSGTIPITLALNNNPKFGENTQMDKNEIFKNGTSNNNYQLVRLPSALIPHLDRTPNNSTHASTGKVYKFNQLKSYPIIEYSAQRYRLLQQLAFTYILKATGSWMLLQMDALMNGGKLGEDDDDQSDSVPSVGSNALDVKYLANIAPVSAGLKATTTTLTHSGLLKLRELLGGNGYLQSTGVGDLWATYVWETTAEGEAAVMKLLCAKHILFRTLLSFGFKSNKSGGGDTSLNTVPKVEYLSYATQQQVDAKFEAICREYYRYDNTLLTQQTTYYLEPLNSVHNYIINKHISSIMAPFISDNLSNTKNVDVDQILNEIQHLHDIVINTYISSLFESIEIQGNSFKTNYGEIFKQYINGKILSLQQIQLLITMTTFLMQIKSILIWKDVLLTWYTLFFNIVFSHTNNTNTIENQPNTYYLSLLTALRRDLSPKLETNDPQQALLDAFFTSSSLLNELIINNISYNLLLSCESHCKYVMYTSFTLNIVDTIIKPYNTSHVQKKAKNELPNSDYRPLLPSLMHLAVFYTTSEYIESSSLSSFFLQHIPHKTPLISTINTIASNALVHDIIALTDSFDLSDTVLASTVGSYSGDDIYESLFVDAINNSDNNKQTPYPGYNHTLGPRMHKEMLIEGKSQQNKLYSSVFGQDTPRYALPTDGTDYQKVVMVHKKGKQPAKL